MRFSRTMFAIGRRSGVAMSVQFCFAMVAHATVATYNFDSQAIGTTTPLSIIDNGITASFSSPSDSNAFEITDSFFATLTGNVLADGINDTPFIPLHIDFSQAISNVSMRFALNDSFDTGLPLNLTTNTGETASASGMVYTGASYPEGVLTFSGAPFSSLDLSSSINYFAIDDLTVTSAVPEPPTASLLSAGLFALGSIMLRKRCGTGWIT